MARRPRIDRELAKYLVDGEQVIVAVRRHWFALVREALLVALTLTLAVWVDVSTTIGAGGQALRNITLFFFWASVAWLTWKVLEWRHEWFVATDKRFLLFYGFIRRRVAMMPLIKVTDMTFDRTPLGRVVGYGSFVLESAGQDQALSLIPYVPDADAHYHAICTVLFGPGAPPRIPPQYGGGWGGAGGGGSSGGGPGGEGGPGGGGPGEGVGANGRDRSASGWSGDGAASGRRGDGGPGPRGGPVGIPIRDPEGENPGPAVVVGPGDRGVRVPHIGRHRSHGPEPESWYRSSNVGGPTRLGDTGEIPVVEGGREDTDEVPLYPPRDWMD
jgi:membrane protein YdbS with pleckstrin-like domain